MDIKLDMSALNALFPAETEARVRLQQCVIEEFTRKHIKALANDYSIKQSIAKATADMQTEALAEFGKLVRSYGSTTFEFSAEHKAKLKKDYRALILEELKPDVTDWSKLVYAEVRAQVLAMVKTQLNAEVSKSVTSFVQEALNNAVSGLGKIEIKDSEV